MAAEAFDTRNCQVKGSQESTSPTCDANCRSRVRYGIDFDRIEEIRLANEMGEGR